MKLILLACFFVSSTSAFLGLPFGRQLSKNSCPIKLYQPKDSSFIGVKLYAHVDTFHPLLDILSEYAKRCQVKVNVKRAFTPQTTFSMRLNEQLPVAFRLGEAIEFDLVDRHDRTLCNRSCLGKSLSQLKRIPHAKCFVRKLKRDQHFQRDPLKPTILMKRHEDKKSFRDNDEEDQRKILQDKCKNLDLA